MQRRDQRKNCTKCGKRLWPDRLPLFSAAPESAASRALLHINSGRSVQQLGLWEEKEAGHLRHISSTFVIFWHMLVSLDFGQCLLSRMRLHKYARTRCVMDTPNRTWQ